MFSKLTRSLTLSVALGAILLLGVIASYVVLRNRQVATPQANAALIPTPPTEPADSAKPLETGFYDLQISELAFPNAFGVGRAALAAIGHGLFYAAPDGTLYHLPRPGTLRDPAAAIRLDPAIPLNLSSPAAARYRRGTIAVLDIAVDATPSGSGSYYLYASHVAFKESSPCIFLRLSRMRFALDGDRVIFDAPVWEHVFDSAPCVSTLTAVVDTGGRIAFARDTLILTVGTWDQDAQDDATHYGKILRIDPTTHRGTAISKGHRNQQGLFAARSGTLFATEQGLRGGDEINIIEEGQNYGWPRVTYGTAYEVRTYPYSKEQGKHHGYRQPLFAFVPAIGISQIIQITSLEQFPIWQGDLIASSLLAQTLFRVHVQDGRVLVVEPIAVKERIRDMVELPDGRLALLTDSQKIMFISHASLSPAP